MVGSHRLFDDGLAGLLHDNRTEWPSHPFTQLSVDAHSDQASGLNPYDSNKSQIDGINTLQRFNLFPELVLAGLYRLFLRMGFISAAPCFVVSRALLFEDTDDLADAIDPQSKIMVDILTERYE
ncbi:unnamed protein product [Protopolystoma xenopodis]|uniref:Uncharacterized protein n=1 Tax=Protopolystoma xenopodis TaxID=117903 RepID=A0A448WSD3_9PLAT|nr:unnamed protein product [Protopolystoma xenopodis]